MTTLATWVQTPLAGAIGWTLLHSVWEGAIISAALAAALIVLRSPRARYASSTVAMLMMLAAFGLTFVLAVPEQGHGFQASRTYLFPAGSLPSGLDDATPSYPLAALVPWLTPIWITGVWFFYLGQLASWMSVCRLRRRGVCCAAEHWQNELARLSARLRLSRTVLLLESCLVDAPMLLGYFRPVILVPIGLLAGLPAGQVEAILLHELAHIRRYDYLVNVVQRLVEDLFFYHPAVWWISRVIRTERENCCDDVVVAMNGNAHEYAVALAALEQNRQAGCEPAVAATGGNLVRRIRRLLYPRGPNGAWPPLLAAVILMATASLVLVAWQAAPAQPQAGKAETSPYDIWLNQDVVYIITDQERAAWKRLQTDEEREHFIEQFWLRRDPTPDTVENEFKEDHYRRIAFANKRFATMNLDGWKTDRGRIYILWGPPDEIESHPSGGAYERPPAEGGGSTSTFPFEQWLYRYIDGVGNNVILEFVDATGTGDYRMTMDAHAKEYVPSVSSQPGSRGEPHGIFVSKEPGAKVTVEITPERRMLVSVPVEFDAKQYWIIGTTRASDGRMSRVEFRALVALCKNAPGTPGCLDRPVFHPDPASPGIGALQPGSYVLNTFVKDFAGSVERAYIVQFEVK